MTVSSWADAVRAVGFLLYAQQRDEVIDYFATHKSQCRTTYAAKAVDSINDCIQLRSSQQADLHVWLKAQPK